MPVIELTTGELAAIYALSGAEGIGRRRLRTLMLRFGNAGAILKAGPEELSSLDGLDRVIADSVLGTTVHEEHRDKAVRIREAGIRIYHLMNPDYPSWLREIPDAPVLLYGTGELLEADQKAIAVVGTRSSSQYGHKAADELTRELVGQGFTIVSGLARGIDTQAHRTALDAGGRTIAVLGSGLDELYPRENTSLAREIARQGCVCTEYFLGAMPDAPHFPERNRIISGLSLGTVVIEAGDKSGAILTALQALEQNREVFAVPGSIYSKRSIGTNRLIKHGAKLVQTVDDILEELTGQLSLGLAGTHAPKPPELSPTEQAVYDLLSEEPLHIDALSGKLNRTPARVLGTLLDLELRDIVEQLPGKQFIRRR